MGTGCWAIIGPVSIPPSTKCTVNSVTLTPYSKLDQSHPYQETTAIMKDEFNHSARVKIHQNWSQQHIYPARTMRLILFGFKFFHDFRFIGFTGSISLRTNNNDILCLLPCTLHNTCLMAYYRREIKERFRPPFRYCTSPIDSESYFLARGKYSYAVGRHYISAPANVTSRIPQLHRPMMYASSPDVFSCCSASDASASLTTSTSPTPMLNVVNMSRFETAPFSCNRLKIGRIGQEP